MTSSADANEPVLLHAAGSLRGALTDVANAFAETGVKDVLTLDNLSALYGAKIQRLTDAGGDQAFLPE